MPKGSVGETCKKGEGIKKYKLVVTEGHGDVMYSVGNVVNDNVITMYGVRWVLDFFRMITY